MKKLSDLLPSLNRLPALPYSDSESSTRAVAAPGARPVALRADIESARLSVALNMAALFRVWIVARDMIRRGDGSGKVKRAALLTGLESAGVGYTARHMRRLLAAGAVGGVWWWLHDDTVYVRSGVAVGAALALLAESRGLGAVARNRPGVRDMLVDVAGGLEQFESSIYAAWFASRENPTISRAALVELFGRDKRTLGRWEKNRLAGRLVVRHNFAQCPNTEKFFDYIPREYAVSYTAVVRVNGRKIETPRVRWQLPNSYAASVVQHGHYGAGGKVRRAVNLGLGIPARSGGAGTVRLYVDNAGTVRRMARKNGDSVPVYVWRGVDSGGGGVFEINGDGFPLTSAFERKQHRPRLADIFASRIWRD